MATSSLVGIGGIIQRPDIAASLAVRVEVPLPEGLDTEQVEAEYAHGVVTLRLKKTQPTPAKRIEVKVK